MARLTAPRRQAAMLFLTAIVVGALATLAVTLAASAIFGHKVIAVSDSAMEPTLSEGDLLIAPQVSPDEIGIGELITFSEPGTDSTLTRRVQDIAVAGDRVFFETRPEASPEIERFSVAADGQVAEPLRRIPLLGQLGDALLSAAALILVPLIALLALGCVELSRRFRSEAPG